MSDEAEQHVTEALRAVHLAVVGAHIETLRLANTLRQLATALKDYGPINPPDAA